MEDLALKLHGAFGLGDYYDYIAGNEAKTYEGEYKKGLQTEGGKAELENFKQRALEKARDAGASGFSGAGLEGGIRNQLIQEEVDGLKKAAAAEGKNISAKEALILASKNVAIKMNELGLNTDDVGGELQQTANSIKTTRGKFLQINPSIVKFMSDLDDSIKVQSASLQSRALGTSARNAGLSTIFGGNDRVNFSNNAKTITDQLSADLSGALSAENAAGITQNALGGFIKGDKLEVFKDIARVQTGLGGINKDIVQRLAGNTYGADENVEQFINKRLPSLFEAQGINVTTGEGKDLLAKVKQELTTAAESEGGRKAFEQDRAGFVSGVLQKFGANIDAAGGILANTFAELQQELDKSNASFEQFRSIQQKVNEYQQSVFTTSLSRIQETSTIGASSGQISAGISGMISNLNPGLLNGTALGNAGSAVISAEQNQARLALMAENNPNDPQVLSALNDSQNRTIESYDQYNKILNDTNNAMTLFRARIEETTKQFNFLIETTASAGRKSTSDLNRDRFSLGQFQSNFGGLDQKLNQAGIKTAEQFAALSPEEQQRIAGSINGLAGSKSALASLETAGQYGGARLKGSNIDIAELKKIAELQLGNQNLKSLGVFDDTGARTSALGKSRQEDFAKLGELQNQQLVIQSKINESVLNIYSYLVEKDGSAEDRRRLEKLRSSTPTIDINGGVTATSGPGSSSRELQASLDRLNQTLTTVTGQKTEVKFDGNVKIDGLTGDSKAATGQIVVMFLNEFLKQLNDSRSDPAIGQLADKLQAAIKVMNSDKK